MLGTDLHGRAWALEPPLSFDSFFSILFMYIEIEILFLIFLNTKYTYVVLSVMDIIKNWMQNHMRD